MQKLLLEFVSTLDASLKKLQKEAGDYSGFSRLTISQLGYIDAIHALGNPTITAIAEKLAVTKASVTNGVNKLVALGFIVKTQSSADKRVFHAELTPAARMLVEARDGALRKYGDFIRSALSEEETGQFVHIVSKLVSLFKEGNTQ